MKAVRIFTHRYATLDAASVEEIEALGVQVIWEEDPGKPAGMPADWEFSGDLEIDFELATKVARLVEAAIGGKS